MAQMPAFYLAEKINSLNRTWQLMNTGPGLIEVDPRTKQSLHALALDAQAIVNEIAQWTAEASGGTVTYGDGQPIPHDAPPEVHAQAMAEAFDKDPSTCSSSSSPASSWPA